MQINPERLWSSLEAMARIGATPAGGNNRQTLTDADREARDLLARWGREASCAVSVDAVGNMYLRRPGTQADAAPVMTGSHLDTQPTGGRFDGVYGVLAGLEVLRTLNDAGAETPRPVEVVNWTNEEGSRYQPSCAGSGVFSGAYTLEQVYAGVDREGLRFGDELERIGYRGTAQRGNDAHAYIETHIEQGPILEQEGRLIGAVTSIQGRTSFQVTVEGENGHAGTTPMPGRRDPVIGAARMAVALDALVRERRPDAVATVGYVSVDPGSINVIARACRFTIDMRCPDGEALNALEAEFRQAFAGIAAQLNLAVEVAVLSGTKPTAFDERIVSLVESSAQALDYPVRRLHSGAGHDAKFMADLCPSGMIFIPCERGLSHNEAENITPEHAASGANTLLHALHTLAREP